MITPLIFLESPESENTDPLPGTYQQQIQLQPVVRPEKSGISAQFPPVRVTFPSCRDV